MLTTIDEVQLAHNYTDEIIIIRHKQKENYPPIPYIVDWLDINEGEKIKWLLFREAVINLEDKRKYRNVKLENVEPVVEIYNRKNFNREEFLAWIKREK